MSLFEDISLERAGELLRKNYIPYILESCLPKAFFQSSRTVVPSRISKVTILAVDIKTDNVV